MHSEIIRLLIELFEDVQRWRESGGDPRDAAPGRGRICAWSVVVYCK